MPVWKKIAIILLASALPVSFYLYMSDARRVLPIADFLFLLGLLPWVIAFGLSIAMRKSRFEKKPVDAEPASEEEKNQQDGYTPRIFIIAGSLPVALSLIITYWP